MSFDHIVFALVGVFVTAFSVALSVHVMLRHALNELKNELSQYAESLTQHLVADSAVHATHEARIDALEERVDRMPVARRS